MRKMTLLALALVPLLAASASASSGAEDKCDSLKAAMDAAYAATVGPDADVARAAEALRLAKESQDAAKNALTEITKVYKTSVRDYNAAAKICRACQAKRGADCTSQIQAVKDAYDVMAKWEARKAAQEAKIPEAAKGVEKAKKNLKDMEEKAKGPRKKFLDALNALAKCKNSPPPPPPPPKKKTMRTPTIE